MTGALGGVVLMIKNDGWRFSLQTLLLLMTLVTVLIGVIAADVYW
jgi:hypothetical protein